MPLFLNPVRNNTTLLFPFTRASCNGRCWESAREKAFIGNICHLDVCTNIVRIAATIERQHQRARNVERDTFSGPPGRQRQTGPRRRAKKQLGENPLALTVYCTLHYEYIHSYLYNALFRPRHDVIVNESVQVARFFVIHTTTTRRTRSYSYLVQLTVICSTSGLFMHTHHHARIGHICPL